MPKGQYLLRAGSTYTGAYSKDYPGITQNEVQLYHSCAQLQVDSDSTGVLPKGVLIPEAVQYGQDGMLVSEQMYTGQSVDPDYRYPGGPLWTGKELVEDKPSV
jgi:hypothetical protein